MDYTANFIEAKYHLAVAERMIKGYVDYPEKRFLIGVINETAKAASHLIRSFLIYENVRGDINTFSKKVAPKYLDKLTHENLRKILEVEKAQKVSPIEFAKGDKIILLINGKYRFLTSKRVEEFVRSVAQSVDVFSKNFRQI